MAGTDRRTFLKGAGIVAAAGAVAIAHPAIGTAVATTAVMRPKRRALPHVYPGDPMECRSWNELVDRVNELSDV